MLLLAFWQTWLLLDHHSAINNGFVLTSRLKTCEFPFNKNQRDCLTAKADWFGHFLDTAELERPAEEVPLARCGNWTFLVSFMMVLNPACFGSGLKKRHCYKHRWQRLDGLLDLAVRASSMAADPFREDISCGLHSFRVEENLDWVCVFFPKSSAFEVQVHTLWLILSLPSALPLFNARFFSCSLCTESSICLFVLSVRVLHVEFWDSCLCSSCRTPVIAWSKVHTRRTRSLSRRCTVNVSHRLLELPHGFPRFHFARFFIHSK